MHGYEFNVYLRILKLCKCDVVLGVQWLKVYFPMLFDFIKMKLSFRKEGKIIKLKVITKETGLQMKNNKKGIKHCKDILFGFVR